MPMSEMVKRVREKEAKRKAEQDEVAQRPIKALCEGPAAASMNEDQIGTLGIRKPAVDRAEAEEGNLADKKGCASQARRNFVKAMRPSIN